MKFLVLSVILTLLGSTTAVSQRSQRIVGGTEASIQQYSFLVSMHYRWFNMLWHQECAGTLITSTLILSAAHCYHGDSSIQWRAQLGSSQPQSGGTIHAISRILNHPGYAPSHLDFDVALLWLSTPANLNSDYISTAAIAGPQYKLPDNTPITAVGWGALYTNGPSSEVLQHVSIRTINWELCRTRYAYLKSLPDYYYLPDITENMSCAGILDLYGGQDSCQGDCGGPVLHNDSVVYGITSWGFRCGHEHYPGVNADVSNLSPWILENASVLE